MSRPQRHGITPPGHPTAGRGQGHGLLWGDVGPGCAGQGSAQHPPHAWSGAHQAPVGSQMHFSWLLILVFRASQVSEPPTAEPKKRAWVQVVYLEYGPGRQELKRARKKSPRKSERAGSCCGPRGPTAPGTVSEPRGVHPSPVLPWNEARAPAVSCPLGESRQLHTLPQTPGAQMGRGGADRGDQRWSWLPLLCRGQLGQGCLPRASSQKHGCCGGQGALPRPPREVFSLPPHGAMQGGR